MGTHRLAWTQSVSRRRWLATKLAVAGLAAVLLTAVVAAAFTWWSLPFDRLGTRIGTANFGQRGIAPVAYALFALVLGTLLGTLIRRTLPAMAATLFAFFVARFTFQWVVRPRLVAPEVIERATNTFGTQKGSAADGAWVISSRTVDWAGRTVGDVWSGEVGRAMERVCGLTAARRTSEGERIACMNQLGVHDIVRAHPADHFWALQAWESVAFVGAAIVLGVVCFWWLRRRTS